MNSDDAELLISGLQHLTFCEKQWALIHLEGLWEENVLTAEGSHLHERVHKIGRESRGEVKLATGLELSSARLGLYGVADMVEFRHDEERGVRVAAFGGRRRWLPYPVEYKHGRKRPDTADEMQLCAQAVCLEEMLGVEIPSGAVYYGEPKRRTEIELTPALRAKLEEKCARARAIMSGEAAPEYNVGKHCKSCSMNKFCMPEKTGGRDRSARYVAGLFRLLSENTGDEEGGL
ncbi:CRISPR-associated protein Cas4 [Cloacibacillus sp. An23]|uniref:CRISPR-associated protein Cas4 n=1 Tax=Cloacibacillus sp. An23 TaxID=1965591 RepID=UPI000B3AE3D5|nr:CRISPR-associated protein Cas4 [Cloacibacillus sp. An23]OUO94105.1 CRISPR-associated protein Cas4 [Cloacibacillus sp. An23]